MAGGGRKRRGAGARVVPCVVVVVGVLVAACCSVGAEGARAGRSRLLPDLGAQINQAKAQAEQAAGQVQGAVDKVKNVDVEQIKSQVKEQAMAKVGEIKDQAMAKINEMKGEIMGKIKGISGEFAGKLAGALNGKLPLDPKALANVRNMLPGVDLSGVTSIESLGMSLKGVVNVQAHDAMQAFEQMQAMGEKLSDGGGFPAQMDELGDIAAAAV